jgi:putative oxidoreductase
MLTGLPRLEPYAYSALRVAGGVLFVFHGLQKFGLFGGLFVELASRLGAAAVIEVVAGTLIAIGLVAVPAAIVASGEMAFAYALAHYPRGPWPIQNGGELAVLYGFLFLFVATRGPGPVSLDRVLKRR